MRPTAYCTPDVLAVTEVPTPHAADGDVVVEVRAAGVNPIDWKLYSGAFHEVDENHKDAASMPSIGLECAGVVTEVGQDVTRVQIGDEVIVYPVTAAYADYVTAPATSVFAKPAGLGWAEAGSMMLTGTTAAERNHALLRELGGHGEDAGAEVRDAARGGLIDSVESGALRVIVDTTFPLVEAGKAHEVGLAGHAPGKLVLIP